MRVVPLYRSFFVNEEIKNLIDQIIQGQEEKVLACGRVFIPNLTSEDVLQPVDYPMLENSPLFRYEEGSLAGMHTIRSALLAYFQDIERVDNWAI